MAPVVAGYVRRSSRMQADNFSIDAQKRALQDGCSDRHLPDPIFYEDDELSARSEQIAKRPAFKQLLDDVEAGRIQVVMVHTLDRWSRNVMVTLQSFRILAERQTAFISISEHIDYSSPEGRLQLTILAAFSAYFSDMLAKHTSKGKGERAAQGLFNGDVPFGYRRTGPKTHLEPDPATLPGLRLIGELRMQGMDAERIAETVNAAGFRTGSKRFGQRLFTKDTINAIVRNPFYAAFAPDDDRGTVLHHGERHRGLHQAAFTFSEWEKIRAGSQLNLKAPRRAAQARKVYEFAGFIADIHCGLTLRCRGAGGAERSYYKDVAKTRQMPCPAGGFLQVRTDQVREQFGALLEGFSLPEDWREEVRRRVVAAMEQTGTNRLELARERERLLLKRGRILKQHRDGYIGDKEMQMEIATVDLALSQLEMPETEGVKLDAILDAGERLPGIAALWAVATPEERRELVAVVLESGGLYYDLELKLIAAIKPRPVFLPVLRLTPDFLEYQEATGTLVTRQWQQRNRRASTPLPDNKMCHSLVGSIP
jgi:DNA invertase Pin-like site-specific DNA recombinase/transposase-like protein